VSEHKVFTIFNANFQPEKLLLILDMNIKAHEPTWSGVRRAHTIFIRRKEDSTKCYYFVSNILCIIHTLHDVWNITYIHGMCTDDDHGDDDYDDDKMITLSDNCSPYSLIL